LSPDGHKTTRTIVYVVGGLVGLSLVGGIIAFVAVADAAKSAANAPIGPAPGPLGPINAGAGALPIRRVQINSQLSPR